MHEVDRNVLIPVEVLLARRKEYYIFQKICNWQKILKYVPLSQKSTFYDRDSRKCKLSATVYIEWIFIGLLFSNFQECWKWNPSHLVSGSQSSAARISPKIPPFPAGTLCCYVMTGLLNSTFHKSYRTCGCCCCLTDLLRKRGSRLTSSNIRWVAT